MSEDKKIETAVTPAADSVQEIKGEFTRKLTNTEAKIEETRKTLSAQIEQMNAVLSRIAPAAPVRTNDEADLNTLIFDNPAKALSLVEDRAEKRIMEKLQAQQVQQSRQTAVLSQLVQDFPELSNNTADLTKRAIELHNELSAEEKLSPTAYKAAVYQAATELGVVPNKKRKNSDDFSLGGASGGRTVTKKSRLTDESLDFARLMGLDIEKEETVKRLEKHAERNGKLGE